MTIFLFCRFRLIKREVVNTLVKKSKVDILNLDAGLFNLIISDGGLVPILHAGSERGQHDIQGGDARASEETGAPEQRLQ